MKCAGFRGETQGETRTSGEFCELVSYQTPRILRWWGKY